MIRSMTAFARSERETPFGRLSCELRSVNHRYLELGFRLPETLRATEPGLRDLIRKRVERGKLDCTVRLTQTGAEPGGIALDPQALGRVLEVVREVRTALGDAAGPTDPLELLRWPGVVREPEVDPDAVMAAVADVTEEALGLFLAHREREGTRLAELIEQRLGAIEAITLDLRSRADELADELRDRLRERARALAAELAPERLEQEVAILAQKADVAEELERLETHVVEMRGALGSDAPVGRRLDFLAQELGREANTLASKAPRADVARLAVDLKVLIEQIREQIQNLE